VPTSKGNGKRRDGKEQVDRGERMGKERECPLPFMKYATADCGDILYMHLLPRGFS